VAPALTLREVTKRFGAAEIIRGVDLTVEAGERHALIGPNGAGKSTLFHLISGRIAPTSGSISLAGERTDGLPPERIARRGLARSFQITSIFPGLSAFENIRVAVLARLGLALCTWRRAASLRNANDEAMARCEAVRLARRANVYAGDLSYPEQRALELGITLALDPAVVLLDEPTAGMSREEAEAAVDLVRRTTEGRTLLVIEHDMDIVFGLSDRISVLVNGQVIATAPPAGIAADESVRAAYLGAGAHAQ
jgi:branched-chain amino acid transport system ATP-binding protein